MDSAAIKSLLLSEATCPKPVVVDLNGLGQVYVRVMTAYDSSVMRERLDAVKKRHEAAGTQDHCLSGRMLAFFICNENGEMIFDPENETEVMHLSRYRSEIRDAIQGAAMKANGMEEGKELPQGTS